MPYKLPDNRWMGVVRLRVPKCREEKIWPTKKDAAKWEADRKDELLRSLSKGPECTVLLELTKKYLDHSKASFTPKTFSEKKTLSARLIDAWGPLAPCDEITSGMVLDFLGMRGDNNNSFNKDRKNLLAMWKFGQDFLDVKSDPVSKIKKRRHTEAPQYTPPVKNVLALYAVCTIEERVFLDAYLQTAARRSEIFRWSWAEDINFTKKQVRLGTRKTIDGSMSYEWLPMSDDLYESLWWWWQNHERIYTEKYAKKYPKTYGKLKDNPYVFPSRNGQPHKERRYFLKKLCDRAEIPAFGYHALRRHVASVLADVHKQSMKTVQQVLRHKKVSTTEKYVKSINSGLEETMNLLSKNRAENKMTDSVTDSKKTRG